MPLESSNSRSSLFSKFNMSIHNVGCWSPLEMCAGQNLQERERKEMHSRLKKIFLLPVFFRFFSFLERVFPLFPIFLGISHPILRRSFPIFSSFHLSKPVPGFLMGLKLAILERVLNENLCKPVPLHSSNRSSPFLKSFLVFPQPVFLVIRKNGSQKRPQYLKAIYWPAFNKVLQLCTTNAKYY